MGGKESKQFPVSTEDALKRGKIYIWQCIQFTRHKKIYIDYVLLHPPINLSNFLLVTDVERRRLQDAFRRYSNSSGYITRLTFLRDILGDSIPSVLAEQIYSLCLSGKSITVTF